MATEADTTLAWNADFTGFVIVGKPLQLPLRIQGHYAAATLRPRDWSQPDDWHRGYLQGHLFRRRIWLREFGIAIGSRIQDERAVADRSELTNRPRIEALIKRLDAAKQTNRPFNEIPD